MEITIKDFMEELEADILKKPWTCICCGALESKGNIFLKYDFGNGDEILCDDCAYSKFLEKEKDNKTPKGKGE